MKTASSPTAGIDVFVVFGRLDDFAASNIFSFCIDTDTVIFGGAGAVQLHRVFATGEPLPTVLPTTMRT